MQACSDLLQGSTHTPNQIEFLRMIVDQLVDHGLMDPARLYASPISKSARWEVDRIVGGLREIEARATG